KTCRECGNDVSTRAKKCPSCGAPTAARGKVALGCFGAFVVLIILVLLLPDPEETERSAAPLTEGAPPAAPSMSEAPEGSTVAAMGETVSPGYMTYRVERARWSARLSSNEFLDQPPAAMYLIVTL